MLARVSAGAGQAVAGVARQAFCAAAIPSHMRGRIVGMLGGISECPPCAAACMLQLGAGTLIARRPNALQAVSAL